MYGVEGTDVAYSAPGAATSTTTYDEHERPSEVTFHDANDALVSRVVFSRDQEGRVLSERMEFAGPGGLLGPAFDANVPTDERASLMELLKTVFELHTFSLVTYAYDEKGRRIESVRRMGKLSEERVTVRYDDFDNPVEEVRSDVNREMRMDDGAVKSEERPSHVQHVRFEYQYTRTETGPSGLSGSEWNRTPTSGHQRRAPHDCIHRMKLLYLVERARPQRISWLEISPRRAAIVTSSASESAFIFRIT